MKKTIEYKSGQTLGDNNVIFLKDITLGSGRRALFKCHCGNEFTTRLNSIKNNVTKGCGCNRGIPPKHGLTNHPLYRKWDSIKQRCFNKNNKAYKNYGGRGITMYKLWINDPVLFIEDIKKLGEKPEGFTLDRINNDGNYEPNNLRWADWKTQLNNKRQRKSKK